MKRKLFFLLTVLSFSAGAVAVADEQGRETGGLTGDFDGIGDMPDAQDAPPPAAPAPDAAPSSNYVIQPADVLKMHVFQEPDLAQEFRVPQDGRHRFPLIGTVELAGLTVGEAEEKITELYNADYLVNPQINLLVLQYAQRRVNVLGTVNQPGTVVFPPEEDMTLLDALSRAGGWNRMSALNRVTVTRTNEDGETEVIDINADRIIRGDADDIELEMNDIINVPERRI